MITVTTKVHFSRGPSGRKRIRKGQAPEAPKPRVPRVSKLMALAIRFDKLIRDGKVWDQSDLARLAHVSQPRMTQIMNLLHLASGGGIRNHDLLVMTGRDVKSWCNRWYNGAISTFAASSDEIRLKPKNLIKQRTFSSLERLLCQT